MSSEILSVLEYMEKEKGIPRPDMIATITSALKTAAQKGISSGQELKIEKPDVAKEIEDSVRGEGSPEDQAENWDMSKMEQGIF